MASAKLFRLSKIRNVFRPEKLLKGTSWCQRRFLSSSKLPENKSQFDSMKLPDTLILTDACVERLKTIGEDLRIVVEGGGCSGFQYKFELDNKPQDDDLVFERNGVKVMVDVDSFEFIKNSTIDYEVELIRSAFRIVKNPQAEHGCSCGASFSVSL